MCPAPQLPSDVPTLQEALASATQASRDTAARLELELHRNASFRSEIDAISAVVAQLEAQSLQKDEELRALRSKRESVLSRLGGG